MGEDTHGTDDQYEAAYRGARDAVSSASRTGIMSVVLLLVGLFGVAMLSMTAIALYAGTATRVTVVASVFGAATTAFAGYELYHL